MTNAVVVSIARTGTDEAARGTLTLTIGTMMGGYVIAVARAGPDPALLEDRSERMGNPEWAVGDNVGRQFAISSAVINASDHIDAPPITIELHAFATNAFIIGATKPPAGETIYKYGNIGITAKYDFIHFACNLHINDPRFRSATRHLRRCGPST